MMSENEQGQVKSLSVVITAMSIGILLFSLVAIALNYYKGNFIEVRETGRTVFLILLVIAIVVFFWTGRYYKNRVNHIRESNNPQAEKLYHLRKTVMTQLALLEGVALGGIVCFLLFGDYLFFIPVAIGLFGIISKRPRPGILEEIL